jgi:hypothetical protein
VLCLRRKELHCQQSLTLMRSMTASTIAGVTFLGRPARRSAEPVTLNFKVNQEMPLCEIGRQMDPPVCDSTFSTGRVAITKGPGRCHFFCGAVAAPGLPTHSNGLTTTSSGCRTPDPPRPGQKSRTMIPTAKVVQDWLREHDIPLFPHPPCSPNVSPIESCWLLTKRILRYLPPQERPTTTVQLQHAVRKAWDDITLRRLISSSTWRVDSGKLLQTEEVIRTSSTCL